VGKKNSGLATPSLGCSIFLEPGDIHDTLRNSASVLYFDLEQSNRQIIWAFLGQIQLLSGEVFKKQETSGEVLRNLGGRALD